MKNPKMILTFAAYIVLFIFTLIFGFIDKPKEMGLSILAGFLGLAFLNLDKIKKFKGAGFEAEMQEKIEAIIEKETEPAHNEDAATCGFKAEIYVTDEKSKKIIKSLLNPKYTWRYLSGITKESGLEKHEALEILNWLLDNELGKHIEGECDKLWSLTAKGRNVFKNITNA